ncbi:50S ribosomal protein L4 [Candidatus Woesearchaeota archaeon CG_4_10_14_0_8_um_filter_47_5]|nr:MAG: 50S ribosomal protein L4 [Candidatus Woesearchaeota archaeon CG_4_10_14_0_8_um_filter_47_5]
MNRTNKETETYVLPLQFSEEVRPVLIKRAVLAILANRRQPYGSKPTAGMRSSVRVSKRRRDYRGSYGHGISRVARKVLSRQGRRFNWVGAFTSQTTGGRQAHPPKAEKNWNQKINTKERRKAIRSAITATIVRDLVAERGHKVPEPYPFALESAAENLTKTQEVITMLISLGFEDELERASYKQIRAGKGKMRGRKYKRRKGPLVVVSGPCSLSMAAKNIPGLEVVSVKKLNAELLAPGTKPGRVTLWTKKALETLEKEKLFM